jgi:multidrug efflux pump subunit AcrA (membrane-fusion protein)
VVSNPGALYVEVEVTSDDAKTLSIGNTATVGEGVPGVITFIAPALDPTTGKIEVKVGITGNTSSLSDGEITALTLNRAQNTSTGSGAITIPIIAANISPTGPIVFTVGTSSVLVGHPIELGVILADHVVVTSGLSKDMRIVTDARGLSEGQTVIVDPE